MALVGKRERWKEGRKEYYIQRPATRAEEDGSTMKDPYLAN